MVNFFDKIYGILWSIVPFFCTYTLLFSGNYSSVWYLNNSKSLKSNVQECLYCFYTSATLQEKKKQARLVSSLSLSHFHFISRPLPFFFFTNAASLVFPPYLVILCKPLKPIWFASAKLWIRKEAITEPLLQQVH